uniref:Uncharacterized protein n=1 Tax=Caenorhabditis japonica TaxID=281687 RepID=A0A8R1HKG3_CAEJA
MLIAELIENLSEKAVITPLTPSSVIVFDKNELKIFLGFTNSRNSVEFAKEVKIELSTPIAQKAEIREIVVSKNADFVVLHGSRTLQIVRIGAEILMSKPDRLASECFCESYPLHDSLFLQNPALAVQKTRILTQKCDDKQILTVLYSDNVIRFYNIQRKTDSLLLAIDFRRFLHQDLNESVANNTFGLQKGLVSFDIIAPQPNAAHFSLIAIDSDAEFYGCFVYFKCFQEGVAPRIHRLEAIDGLPCDPLDLKCLDTSNPKICSIFVLVSGGGVLSHLAIFPNEFGEFQILVNDQLRLPTSSGDPKIVPNQIKKLNRNRYEIATATCLFSVNISPWFDSPSSTSSAESRVCELVSAVAPSELAATSSSKNATWTGTRALRAISVLLTPNLVAAAGDDDENDLEPEVMHLVILDTNRQGPEHVFTVVTFDKTWNVNPTTSAAVATPTLKRSANIEQQLAQLKPLPACVISDKISQEEALDAASKFIDLVEERSRKHQELAMAAVERSLQMAATSQVIAEKQQSVDELLIEETAAVEELKMKMYELRARVDATRKTMNVLFHRVEENVPLSDNEARIFERLQEHQKMLSDMSIQVPKVSLDTNEIRRMADILARKRGGEEPNKFEQIEKK